MLINATNFWKKVVKTETCWIWTGATKKDGYGTFWIEGKSYQAHHVAWLLIYGRRPKGLEADHVVCQVHNCVNPDHLEWVTHAENMRRNAERSLTCRRGHVWSEQTPIMQWSEPNQNWQRKCRHCDRMSKDRNR